MALEQVRNPLLQREKRVLVAIDEAVRKTENLSMICTLCHHFTAAPTSRSSRIWLFKKLQTDLGKEAVDEFQKFFAAQKRYNELNGYTTLPHGLQDEDETLFAFPRPIRADLKPDLVGRLKERPDKRTFIRDVMTFVKRSGNITERQGLDVSQPISVVKLLRAALQSKYREHVRRCFREMDVESLINILYLMIMPSSSPEQSSVTKSFLYDDMDVSPLSSITVKDLAMGEQIESFYYLESPLSTGSSDSSKQSFFWDDEETVIGFVEDVKDETTSPQVDQSETKAVWKQDLECKITGMQEKFRSVFSISVLNQIMDVATRQFVSESHVYFSELDVMDLYDKFSKTVSREKLKDIMLLLTNGEKEEGHGSFQVDYSQSLIQVLYEFRSLVLTMFASHHRKSGGIQRINRMVIDFKLLSIQEDKLEKMLNDLIATHKGLQERLDSEIKEWKGQVDETRAQTNQQIKSSIKGYVTAEISIGKSREKEIFDFKKDLGRVTDKLSNTKGFVTKTVKSLRARRHYLEASLESLIRQYEATMLKYQHKIDELCVEEEANNKHIEGLQNKFKDIEEKYDEMRAMQRLKQLLANMEKAEAIKQNWAARKIQMAWRKYKVAKLRKKKLKGRRKGKKKTPPPPGKGSSPPAKSSTPGSRSKSQTP